jgi:outer membrane lipoprotein LolB
VSAYSPKCPDAGSRVLPSWQKKTAIVSLALLLNACAVQRGMELPDLPDWESRQATLAAINTWEFQGRIAVKASDDGFNGSLRWWQNGDLFLATVSGPFGAGAVKIEGDERLVRITDPDGVVTEMQDAELELQLRYGWTIPVASLRYWALGIPDPLYPSTDEFDERGQLRQLQQRDWAVTIDEYRDGGGQPMPRRLSATNPDTRLRLVIDRWKFL